MKQPESTDVGTKMDLVRHRLNVARVKYPAALQRYKLDTPLLAAGSLISE